MYAYETDQLTLNRYQKRTHISRERTVVLLYPKANVTKENLNVYRHKYIHIYIY